MANSSRRIFLLSPAFAGGKRAHMTMRKEANFELAVRLREEGAPLGEVFSFLSGLYFRGKIHYANTFAAPPEGIGGALVIVAGRGLLPVTERVSIADLEQIAGIPIDLADPRYRDPLDREARSLAARIGSDCEVVLLGSVATAKYVEPLLAVFGERLLFPEDFAGRGDMSRGGLMLRCAREGVELRYVPVLGATRHGPRPPKLARLSSATPR